MLSLNGVQVPARSIREQYESGVVYERALSGYIYQIRLHNARLRLDVETVPVPSTIADTLAAMLHRQVNVVYRGQTYSGYVVSVEQSASSDVGPDYRILRMEVITL